MALPFMPFYWGDYWRDTAHLSDAEHVSYLRLISHYWQHGSLPTDDARLSRIAGRSMADWMMMRPTLSEFFQIDWRHKRIDRDLEKHTEISEANSNRAKRAAIARWKDKGMLGALPQAIVKQSLSDANHIHNHNHISEPKPKAVIARGTRLPPDWKPEGSFDQGELDRFRDYWIAKAGKDGVKLDWQATWRNWCRNSAQWKPQAPIAKPPETYRVGHAKGIFKREPEAPELTPEEKAERARRVDEILRGARRPVEGLGEVGS